MVYSVDNRLAALPIDVHCPQQCILVLGTMGGCHQGMYFVLRACSLYNTKGREHCRYDSYDTQ